MATTGGTAGRTAAMDGPSPGALLRSVSLALLAGALSGLAAGVLSRAAMRLLTLTSTDDARGLLTDDQALVGQVTLGGSLFVVLTTAVCSDRPGWERRRGLSCWCTRPTPSTTACWGRTG
jgi:hypothetical protein